MHKDIKSFRAVFTKWLPLRNFNTFGWQSSFRYQNNQQNLQFLKLYISQNTPKRISTITFGYDLINCLNTKRKPGLLPCLDFEKTFDSTGGSCFGLFKHLILEETFVDLSGPYKNKVNGNSERTQWFTIERGCRQSDPISPYIFVTQNVYFTWKRETISSLL